MSTWPYPRSTPWVWRLIVANAVALLLLWTLLPSLTSELAFDPRSPFSAPWTAISYMLVHGGLIHLAVNMLLLFFLGTRVEQRMGHKVFPLYYLFCGLGGPVLASMVSLAGFASPPFVGASGAVFGVAVAFAMYWPEAEIVIFPLPIPLKARTFVLGLLGIDLLMALIGAASGVAHWAHLGGALFGYMYFRFHSYSRPVASPRTVKRERVLVSKPEPLEATASVPTPRPRRRAKEKDPVAAEIDRVLDKISATGIDSLTNDEKRFLDEVSKRKQDENLH